jgi:hypothetical protein
MCCALLTEDVELSDYCEIWREKNEYNIYSYSLVSILLLSATGSSLRSTEEEFFLSIPIVLIQWWKFLADLFALLTENNAGRGAKLDAEAENDGVWRRNKDATEFATQCAPVETGGSS